MHFSLKNLFYYVAYFLEQATDTLSFRTTIINHQYDLKFKTRTNKYHTHSGKLAFHSLEKKRNNRCGYRYIHLQDAKQVI